jgi:hypothetical protein
MRALLAFLMALMIIGCGQRSERDGGESANQANTDEQGFTLEERDVIRQISDLDCQLQTLFRQSLESPEIPEMLQKIRELREEKKTLVSRIMEINSDSVHLDAVKSELRRLRDMDGYCPELKQDGKLSPKTDKNGVPLKSLNIIEDATRLARLNCRILDVYKKLEENLQDNEAKRQLVQLRDHKRTLLHQLMLMYGNDILTDEGFRTMVMDIQDEECHYRAELVRHNRMNPFIP